MIFSYNSRKWTKATPGEAISDLLKKGRTELEINGTPKILGSMMHGTVQVPLKSLVPHQDHPSSPFIDHHFDLVREFLS